ncbi:MAG TPA: zf-HC2 domain-containing protein [Bacteroidetes bacterium]|nr:zf-HC2 domain-containing protein [Bacteroidota bacterium]
MKKSPANLLMMLLHKLTPSCDIVTRKVSESLDRKLNLWEKIQVSLHLMVCEFCNRYRDQLLAIHQTLERHSHAGEPPPELGSLSEEAKAKMKQALQKKRGER